MCCAFCPRLSLPTNRLTSSWRRPPKSSLRSMNTFPLTDAIPAHEEIERPSSIGETMFIRHWQPEGETRGSAVLAHGVFEHSGRYHHVAERFTRRGYQVWAPDHYGHGRSAGPRGYIQHPNHFIDDLRLVVELATMATGCKPILLGHSMGGTIAALYAIRQQETLRALVLSSPALRIHASDCVIAIGRIVSDIIPAAPMPSGLSQPATHNQAWEAWKASDALRHNRLTFRTARFIVDAGEEARAQAHTLGIPVLLLVAGEDTYVDKRGAHEFFARLPANTGELHEYAGFYHEIFNEVERETPLSDLDAWLEKLDRGARRG
ncbi:MAG: alpha/beta hydrolase [Candidatus Thermofonsia Clade 3 bacterium]|uniref:Alpha/beta hydrolase n=2 Tax=Candidatus Thermofonsia Clade 3 TaxID=2364209 RepID=A0A2M8QG96_9CHLR|nr:MAG: alpha/beta hydrolase [Candidatus Thermofonsia Clade 3 bacterium]